MSDALVYVIDDDPDTRNTVSWLLGTVGLKSKLCASAQQFLDGYQNGVPSCILLDVRMPGMSGLDLQARLLAEQNEVPVIVVTGHADVPMAVRALKLGAFDFIEKPFNHQVILDRVQKAIQKDRSRCEKLAESSRIKERIDQLTRREREVMERVIAGESNKAIAVTLGLSPKTVEVHRAHVMEKMKAKSLAELVRLGVSAMAVAMN